MSRVGDLCGYSAAAAAASATFLKMFRCPQRNGISGHHLHELVRWPASPSRRSDLVAGVASVRVGQVLCFSNVSKAACNSEEGWQVFWEKANTALNSIGLHIPYQGILYFCFTLLVMCFSSSLSLHLQC